MAVTYQILFCFIGLREFFSPLRKNYLLQFFKKTTGEMAEPAIDSNNREFPSIEMFRPFAFPRKKNNHLTVTYLHLHSLVYCILQAFYN